MLQIVYIKTRVIYKVEKVINKNEIASKVKSYIDSIFSIPGLYCHLQLVNCAHSIHSLSSQSLISIPSCFFGICVSSIG